MTRPPGEGRARAVVVDGGEWAGPDTASWVERIARGSTPRREYGSDGEFVPWIGGSQCLDCGRPSSRERATSVRCRACDTEFRRRNQDASFWTKVDQSGGAEACWPWQLATRGTMGYGYVSVDGKPQQAHRIAYAKTNGPIPPGLRVLHRCDNPPCCNPAHLFLGTDADNAADRVSKGRSSRMPGEANATSRLTTETVLAIRDAIAGGATFRGTAARFGVSVWHVQNIVARRRWAHLPDDSPASRSAGDHELAGGLGGPLGSRHARQPSETPDGGPPRGSASPSSSVTPAGAG